MDLSKIFIKNAKPTKVGGQAVLEGLMMRGSRAISLAVRCPDGSISLSVEPVNPPGKLRKVPVLRGILSFADSIATGMRMLMQSADMLEEGGGSTEEQDKLFVWLESKLGKEKAEKIGMYISVLIALIFTIGVFIVLPTLIVSLLRKTGIDSALLLNLVEGLIRIVMFALYITLVSRIPDIKRTFMYHGAEHKTIHCYENELELNVANVQSFYTLHPRCGTSFLMFVMVISLLLFSLLGWPSVAARVISRLILIPLIAGLSYELLQFTGRHDNAFVRTLSMPGIMLQKLTTAEPTDEMVELAIIALKAVLPSHEDPDLPVEYSVGMLTPDGEYTEDPEKTEAYRKKRTEGG